MRNRTDATLVYTSDEGRKRKDSASSKNPSSLPAKGPCKMRLETKGRNGKAVTVLFNLPFTELEAKSLMRELQAQMACGATFKNGQIEFRGDCRDDIELAFAKRQLKVQRAGV